MDRRIPVLLVGVLCACQTYDFLPVSPATVAQTTLPSHIVNLGDFNLMLVVDKSGSMNDKIDSNCTSNCATRLSELKAAMQTFLGGDIARGRLATSPDADSGCGTGGKRVLDIPSAASDVNNAISGIVAGGGTPTAATL